MTGPELKARRKALGLSQPEFARVLSKKLGKRLSVYTVKEWESGRHAPMYPALIARAVAELEQELQAVPRQLPQREQAWDV